MIRFLPWLLSVILAALLVADHQHSALSWASGYGAAVADGVRSADWLRRHPGVAAPVVSAYLRIQDKP